MKLCIWNENLYSIKTERWIYHLASDRHMRTTTRLSVWFECYNIDLQCKWRNTAVFHPFLWATYVCTDCVNMLCSLVQHHHVIVKLCLGGNSIFLVFLLLLSRHKCSISNQWQGVADQILAIVHAPRRTKGQASDNTPCFPPVPARDKELAESALFIVHLSTRHITKSAA